MAAFRGRAGSSLTDRASVKRGCNVPGKSNGFVIGEAVVEIDSPLEENALEKLRKIDAVIFVKQVRL